MTNDFEFERDFNEASVIFAHPEVLTGRKRYRKVLLSDKFQESVIRVVADEARCIVDWKGSVQFPRRVVVGECHAAQPKSMRCGSWTVYGSGNT
ncbi:hypothetical protein ACROYT_G015034 [Oculina patagonica]